MTRRDDAHRDRADELDRAIDALMRGDHSGLDDLPPELAATVDRLFWLSHESGENQAGGEVRDDFPASGWGAPQPVPVNEPIHTARMGAPVSARTMRTLDANARAFTEDASPASGFSRGRSIPLIMRIAAIVLVVVVSGAAIYGVLPLLEESDLGTSNGLDVDDLRLVQLLPEQCPAVGMSRQDALDILRDVDPERDAVLRRSIMLGPVGDEWTPPFDGLNHTFHTWLSCRRFGHSYEAMVYESPYFIREDFYGDTSMGFRNPAVSAYSDDVLNEMLDHRYTADMSARRYWEDIDLLPDPAETPLLRGDTYVSDDRQFVAIRAMQFNVKSETWEETPMVVVFQQVGEPYLLFDILAVPSGHLPYSCYGVSSVHWPQSRTDGKCLDSDEVSSDP